MSHSLSRSEPKAGIPVEALPEMVGRLTQCDDPVSSELDALSARLHYLKALWDGQFLLWS